jgi:hypothetical protein
MIRILRRARKQSRIKAADLPEDEDSMQMALIELLEYQARPGWIWKHSPNEGKRSPREGAKQKKKGLCPGWPDLDLISPEGIWHGLELKTPRGVLTPAQRDFGAEADRLGLRYRVAWGWDNCVICLKEWGVLR